MENKLTYGEIISSPQFWADITKTVMTGTITLITTMLAREAINRMLFGAQVGNTVPIRRQQP